MTSRCVNPKRKQARLRPVYLAVASLAVLIAAGDDAGARSDKRSIESIESRRAGEPLMAIVSLRDQRITVYDAKGWILRDARRDLQRHPESRGPLLEPV